MIEILQVGGLVISVALTVAVLLGVAGHALDAILWRIEVFRANKYKDSIVRDYLEIRRWCGYEFPEVEIVMDELITDHQRGCRISPDDVRNKLRTAKEAKSES